VTLEARLSDPAVWWGAAEYELVVSAFEPIYDRLVERLAPQAGESWLDVATGTGEVAARAARAGAEVTGIDLAPAMIEKARRRPEPVHWEVGDAQELPYPAGGFEVVSSCFGAVFAPDAARTAAELARVCRDRIGLTVWEPDLALQELWAPYVDGPPPAEAWSTEHGIRALLAPFELEIERGVWWVEGRSGAEIWDWFGRAAPPHRERLRRMAPAQVEQVRLGFIALYERHREGELIRYPRPYRLVVGARR
jgi:SAM-dependent methyltransferase